MNTLEKISKHCVSVCQVPVDVPRDFILNHVKGQLKVGEILDHDQVDGIETSRHLTRLVLVCSSLDDVDHMCKEVKEEEITTEDRRFDVKYQPSIACELPERWEKFEGTLGLDSERKSQTHEIGPEIPHRKPKPRKENQQQYPWPQSPFGAISGFYHNIPGSGPNLIQGGMHQQMHGQFPGQPPMPGGEQQPGHGSAPPPDQPMYGQFQGQPPMPGGEQQQGQGHGPQHGHGPQQGQGMNFPFRPGQFPPGFPQGFEMFSPGRQNVHMMPRMMFTPQTGHYFPTFPPPPYNGMSTEVKSPMGEESQAIADQSLEMERLQAKIDRERQSMHHQEDTKEEPIRSEPGTREQVEQGGPEEKPTKIVINDLPSNVDDEYIEMFFENKRNFKGCSVANVEIDEDSSLAIVEFEDPDSVDVVLSKGQIKINGKEVDISVYAPATHDAEEEFLSLDHENKEPSEQGTGDEKPTKIVVCNLPSTAHDEYLQMFFENKRNFKGCNVYSVEIDEDGTSAVIEFEEPESVDIVLSKCPLKMMGNKLDISVYQPPPPVSLCTVEVTGPCSVVCEDHVEMLEMYFENEKRSGGDDIESIRFDEENNMVLVTFESEEVAKRVAERGKHVLRGDRLNVQIHIPSNKPKKQTDIANEEEEKGEEPEPPKMIKVRGVNKETSRDTLEYYFENSRRSGGGEIEAIKSDEEDDDVIYITFKDTQATERVVKKSHTLEGKSLNVSVYTPPVPPPSYDNKILIKGLQASTTQDCLFNFIEAKSGCIPETMDYHSEQEDVVMITFSEDPDFTELENAFRKFKLEDAYLKISRVPISNCIIVANLASDVTKDTIEYYFENTRKSGGGQVEKVVMNDDDSCLVFFADYTVIDRVLEKKHTLSKQLLDVKRYQECLGRPEGEMAERELRVPDDLVLTNVDLQIIKFMEHSQVNRNGLETQLGACYASIDWSVKDEKVVLKCTLTKDVKDCFKLIKQWKSTAETNFQDFMKLIIVKKVHVLQDIWGKVMEELKMLSIKNPETVAIFVDKNDWVITVVGNKNVADSLAANIEDLTKKVMAEVEKEREKIKESITTLKPVETRMLLANKFPVEMEKVFPDLKVKINQNKNEILFEGPLGQVRDAKLRMYEMKANFARDNSVKVSELVGGVLILKQTKDYIVKKLKSSHVTAVWDIVDGHLEVYCTSGDQIQLCVNVINTAVIEQTLSLKKASKIVVRSEKWQDKVDELHGYHQGKSWIKVAEDASKVHICGTDEIVNDLVDSIKKFLRLNTVLDIKVPCTRNVHRLIERHHKEEISNIAKGLTNYNVQIVSIPEYGGFEVHGTEDGLNEAKRLLSQLLLRVKQKEHIMKKPGLAKHMQTAKGKDNLNTIESMQKCVVALKGDDVDDDYQDSNPYDSVPYDSGVRDNIGVKGVKIVASCKVYDCRNIYTMQGDMTELTVEMLVNSADDKLSLTGGLGKAIVQKGGKDIQRECANYIRDNDRLDDGDAFVSTAGNLKADYIVHVRGPVWRGGMEQEDEMLQEAVFKCLQQATARSLTSVAIPAVSCGTYGFPVRKATAIIVAAVKNFFREVQDSTVTEVYLCDMKSNTVDAFNEALSKELGAMNVQKFIPQEIYARPVSKRYSGADPDDDYFIKPMDSDEEDDDYYQSSSNLSGPRGKGPPLPKARSSNAKLGNIAVSIVKGEIAKQKVGVIVNTTAKNLDLKNGAVSASLLKAAGMELQQEVTSKYPNGIKDGEIAVTSGKNLNCDMVVHSSMTNWDGKKDAQCKQALHRLMKDCMEEAQKQQKTSIAFPAIGTGNLGFPRDVVATEMFSAVSKFSNNNPSSSINDVRFIVYQKDFPTIQAFDNEVKRWLSGKQGATGGRQDRKFDIYQDLQQRRYGGGASANVYSDEENLYESLGENFEVVDGSDEANGIYTVGNIKVSVQQGDITAQDAVCIVNSSNDTLDLSRGNVSQAILRKGGKALETEVDAKRKKMKREQVVVTSAPGMNCKHIMHVVAKETIHEWTDIIEKCLDKAENLQMKSIAFPALGTGLQIDASAIATTMTKAIKKFVKMNPRYVEEIRLVIFQQKMVNDFHVAVSNTLQSSDSLSGKFMKSVKGLFGGGETNRKSRQLVRKPSSKKNQDPNTVTFIILAMSEDIIDIAIRKLESCLNKEICSSKFDDSIIKKMNDHQLMEIRAIASKNHLDIKVESSKGHIEISGISANVSRAADNIHRILRQAVTVEQERKTADLMSNLTQWSYIDNSETGQTIKPYDKELNYKIETAYIDKAANVKFTADKITYILDFTKMEEYPEDDSTDSVTVIRRDLVKQGAFEQPALWTDMSGNLRVVVLVPTCQEYTDIAQKFTASAGAGFTVVKIERIQNKTLWSQYQAKKKQLDDQNPPNTTNERLLWHGTAVEAVDNINAHGFNRSYCGKNATVFGDGVYFAVNSSYSCSDTYSRPDSSGLKRVYYCRVLTGEFTQGARGMRVAPSKGGSNSTALYDSVVDRQGAPGMFVIFHDTQAYPEYLLSVKPQ